MSIAKIMNVFREEFGEEQFKTIFPRKQMPIKL